MDVLNRRSFTKQLLIGSLLPLTQVQPHAAQPCIAGHTLSAQERELVDKFLDGHEKRIAPLRSIALPNDLPPAIQFSSPSMSTQCGGQSD